VLEASPADGAEVSLLPDPPSGATGWDEIASKSAWPAPAASEDGPQPSARLDAMAEVEVSSSRARRRWFMANPDGASRGSL
jgi:hypothetical protein